MIEGKAVEDLKLPISSLGIPGFQGHPPHAIDLSCNGSAERTVDEHANAAVKEAPNEAKTELLSSRAASVNGLVAEKETVGILSIDVSVPPFLQSDKFVNEHRLDGPKQEEAPQLDEKETSHRQGNWSYAEILVLLEAKAKEYEFSCSEFKSSRLSSDGKWKRVSEYCKHKGVQRTKEQCRVKWDNMMPDFRKVRDYEEQRDVNAPSYFEIDVWERRMKLLPSNMDSEIYHRISSIQSNKPSKGGLKREAIEKKPLELLQLSVQSSQIVRRMSNGAEGINGVHFGAERPHLADIVGNHVMPLAPRKRRRRRAVEIAFPQDKNIVPVAKMDPIARTDLQIDDDSSTEDDATVVSCRSQQGTPVAVGMFAERTNFLTAHPRSNYESRDVVPDICKPQQQALPLTGALRIERGNSNEVLEGAMAKEACVQDRTKIAKNQEAAIHIQDRKDARHRELMALEREKLAVFREATFAIVNATTNAMAVFSKVAEELLRRR